MFRNDGKAIDERLHNAGKPREKAVIRPGWVTLCSAFTLLVILGIHIEFQRIREGKLFVLALPGEPRASIPERLDAQYSVDRFLVPAMVAAAGIGAAVTFGVPYFRPQLNVRAVPLWLLLLFALACLADLATTLRFFQELGVDHELHPGIRLLAYGYGRTTGAILGKLVQVVGLMALALVSGRYSVPLISAATLLYFSGAIYNWWAF